MLLTLRQIKYWLSVYAKREHNWIIIDKIEDIQAHENKKVFDSDGNINYDYQPINANDINYVYCSSFTKNKVFALLEADGDYYFIDNTRHDDDTFSSVIKVNPDLVDLLNFGMTNRELDGLGIKRIHKMELNKEDQKKLESVVPIDFIDSPEIDKLWIKYLENKTTLDFTDIYVKDNVIVKSNLDNITSVKFNQNMQFGDYNWIKHFKNLNSLTFVLCNTLENNGLPILNNLTTINIHGCYKVTIRILIPILQMPLIQHVCIDNPEMPCQTHEYGGLITNKEWFHLNNHTIEYLFINSKHLSNCAINEILKACHKLSGFYLDNKVFNELQKNVSGGYGPDKIQFVTDNNRFELLKDVKVKNLIKFEDPFSDSMRNLINKMEDEEKIREELERELEKELEMENKI
jgi:hypothetical protein